MSADYVKLPPPPEPPPFDFSDATKNTTVIIPDSTLAPVQASRARSITAAFEALGGSYEFIEVLVAAHYIATGEIAGMEDDDDE